MYSRRDKLGPYISRNKLLCECDYSLVDLVHCSLSSFTTLFIIAASLVL